MLHLVMRMAGTEEPSREPLTLLRFNSKTDMEQYATGCDADIGGTSSVHLDLDESTAAAGGSGTDLDPPRPTAKFWGEMKLAVREGYQGRVKGGYTAFRSKVGASRNGWQ